MKNIKEFLKIDRNVTYFMQYKLHNKYLDIIMKTFTFLGDYCFIWVLIAIILYFMHYRRYAAALVLAMLITNAINNGLIKSVFRRKRPFELYDDITIFIDEPYGSSFPSGHSATGFCCAYVLLYFDPLVGLLACILAGGVAFSRLYLRVHFLTDVIVGIFVGCMCSHVLMEYFLL